MIGDVYNMHGKESLMKFLWLAFAVCVFSVSCSSDNDGPSAIAANSGIFGVVWEMERYTSDTGGIVDVAEETKYQILFFTENTVLQAFIGCVNYSASSYQLNDGYLTIRLGVRNDVECNTDTEEFATQNNAIVGLLEGGGSGESVPLMYSIMDGQLTLEAADGKRLEFAAVDELLQEL